MSRAPFAGTRRPYVRPMAGWWRRDPFFVRYMWREATALVVMAYAVVLMIGVLRLSQGEAAFDGWLQALRSPLSIAFHAVLFVGMVYHVWTWFEVMPKTMPMMFSGGKRVPEATITGIGVAVAVVTNLALLALVWGMRP
ncbi:fumarate reductase subunit C [Ideonella sp. A 288]|uniref:fumarate reductase subunit C n=1 Tax=Ideonella sp. A 288 TaxID=1962181 RepID=UPI000B4AC964|nr:fumarate reductase subunit C [Ideonella sp. A 288]